MKPSFCCSGGAAHGVVLAGALTALRERGLVPQAATGISSGAMAIALAYGAPSRADQLDFFDAAFTLARSRGPRALLPPYDHTGTATLDFLRPFVPHPSAVRASGLQELWVGVSTWPTFRFERHELLAGNDAEAMVIGIARTSMMPFLTHDTLHLQQGLDGAFRHNHFVPPNRDDPSWLFTYARKPWTSGRGPRSAYDRVILLKSPFRAALDFRRGRIERAWDLGHSQGMALDISQAVLDSDPSPMRSL